MVKGVPRQKRKGKKADEMFQAALAGEEGPSERCSVVQIPMAATLGPSIAFMRAHQVP